MNEENVDCLLEWFEKVAQDGKISEEALKNWAVQKKPSIPSLSCKLIELLLHHQSDYCSKLMHAYL